MGRVLTSDLVRALRFISQASGDAHLVMEIDLLATCAFGLEAVVRRELAALGYEGRVISPGKVLFVGDEKAICRTNLWLRSADRVLIRVAHFLASDFDALFDGTKAVDWQQWIPADGVFPVRGRSHKSQLSSVPACQRAVKRAIVDTLLKQHAVETLPESDAEYRVEVALLNDEVTLTIDTTGPSLHKRGYRDLTAGAPLKETMAAALVQLSFWQPERPFWDPFCGSGTIPIEAAMIGRNIAPGLKREFPSEKWPAISDATWKEAREEARDLIKPELPEILMGTDLDAGVLKLARRHAERAGVTEEIHFQQRTFGDLSTKRTYGCLVTNPPYGERLGEQAEIEQLHRSIPETLRRLPTWSHFILTSYPGFEELVQKKADRRRKLYNGRIECTYFQFHGPKRRSKSVAKVESNDDATRSTNDDRPVSNREAPDSTDSLKQQEQAPVFGGLTAKDHEQAELFRSRLLKRARHLRRWPTKRGVTCFRLYDRDIPEVPLVVDRYEDHLHLTEYERPHERDLGRHVDWLELMQKTAADALGVDVSNSFLKRRQRQRGTQQHEHVDQLRHEIEVQEAGLKFIVNLSDYVDTGLFLDHRQTRAIVRDEAQGKNFLNLFAYTGAFSVYAAAGGAKRTMTVDWSSTYLDWAQRNMSLNGFEGDEHKFVRSDASEFLRGYRGPSFDLAVVDPPTFSNSKRTDEVWDVQHDHAELLNATLELMSSGGVIYFSTNFRRFKLAEDDIRSLEVHEISRQTVPEDFRNRRIHRCWRIVRTD